MSARQSVRIRRRLLAGVSLVLTACSHAHAQSLTSDLLRPERDGFSGNARPLQPLQTTQLQTPPSILSPLPDAVERPAESRIGTTPTFGPPKFGAAPAPVFGNAAAAGASGMGFDSLNRKRKQTKAYPGVPKKLGSQASATSVSRAATPATNPAAAEVQQITPPRAQPLTAGSRTPVSASVAGTAAGQPTRRRLKVEDDPFGPVGFRTGGLLSKAAIEFSGGFNTNPARAFIPKGSAFYVIAPELLVASDWSRHSFTADLRGSFTGYGTTFPPPSSIPTVIDRPDFTAKLNGRFDVTKDTRIDSEGRFRLATDSPGSPNIQAGLTRYVPYTSTGGTLGVSQRFNRLDISANGSADRTAYTQSHFTDGSSASNDDRNFNQFGTTARATYEVQTWFKPFVEATYDTRERDIKIDRAGYQRDSRGGSLRGGSTFELSRLVTGEASIGYAKRTYDDVRLRDLDGFLGSASLVWTATQLTTATLTAKSSIDETTLAGVSGVITRDYGLQVDHAFRRWLIGTVRLAFGTSDYDGTRFDKRYSVSGDLVYKLTRTLHIKGQIRHDWQTSTDLGSNTEATVFMLGMRLQN